MDQEFQHTGNTVMRQATKQAEKQVKKTATKTEQKYAEIPSPAEILECSWALYRLGYKLYDVADEYRYGEDRKKLAKLKMLEAAVMNERLGLSSMPAQIQEARDVDQTTKHILEQGMGSALGTAAYSAALCVISQNNGARVDLQDDAPEVSRDQKQANNAQSEKWAHGMRIIGKYLEDDRKLNDPRIKVALLDTGICFDPAGTPEHLAGMKCFTNSSDPDSSGSDPPEAMKDEHGHGVHLAGILYKSASFASLYIGKVATKQGEKPVPERLATAIRFAVKTWQVDIINLSLGYPEDEPACVREAIEMAIRENVLIFAAAGHAKDGKMSFPATMDGVIPVFSFGAEEQFSELNPKPQTISYVCAPGESVRSWCLPEMCSTWLRDIKTYEIEGSYKPMSGTSQATANAVVVALHVLEFARQYRELKQDYDSSEIAEGWSELDSDQNMRSLKQAFGMNRVLRLLSYKRPGGVGPMCLQPWVEMKLNRNQSKPQAKNHIAVRMAEAMLGNRE